MGDVHTCSVGGVDLVRPVIWLVGVELPHLIRQVLRCPRVHVPMWVDGVRLSLSKVRLGLRGRRRTISHSRLARIIARILAVIAEAEETFLEAAVALGGPVPLKTTQLTHPPTPAGRQRRRGAGRRWGRRRRALARGGWRSARGGPAAPVGSIRGGAPSTAAIGAARLDALLSEEKAGVDLMRHHGRRVAPLVDDLDQTIILLVEAVDDERVELGVGERLSNGRQRVNKSLDLVVELRGGGVELLTLAELATESAGTGLRLRREGALEDCPCLMRRLGKNN